jgi:peptidoglycan/xylan/chitin deacetylase (PgdA/CDA1 family)
MTRKLLAIALCAVFGAAFLAYERPLDELGIRACNHSFATEKVLALTFDDGPHPITTPLILDTLRRFRVRATFFVVGAKVDEHPEMVRRIHEAGHQVACHTYSHRDLTRMTEAQVRGELARWAKSVRRVIGPTCGCMRPPGGDYDRATMSVLRKTGYDLALWNVNPGDWRGIPPSEIAEFVVPRVHPGDVVMLHDGGMSTVRALPTIIRRLRREGYGFVTMREIACGPANKYSRGTR